MPALSFTETPAIWFGKPSFDRKHTVSLRLPDSIDVPNKIYEKLNISGLPALLSMIEDNDEKLADYFGEEMARNIERFSRFMQSRDYFAELLNLTVSGVEDNTYYTFIRCSDAAGKENKQPVFLKFRIDDSYEDIIAPQVIASRPTNNSNLKDFNYRLDIFLDEPAECSYSDKDEGYEMMLYDMDCQTSRMQMSSNAGGSYRCTANLDFHEVYIRCKDNPPLIRKYSFMVNASYNDTPLDYEIERRNVILSEDDMFNNTVAYLGEVGSIYSFSMLLPNHSSCRMGFNGFNYRLMDELECNPLDDEDYPYWDLNCSQTLVPDNYTAYVQCIDEEPENRNTNMKSFLLNLSYSSSLSIVSFFPEYDAVARSSAVLGLVVNKDIAEGVECGYTLDGSGEFYMMNKVGRYQFRRSLHAIAPGEHDVEFFCTDAAGNIAEEDTRFVVE
jgi:hypothetical protein